MRIAADLHDSISQILYGLGYGLDACIQMLPHQPRDVQGALSQLYPMVMDAQARMRQTIFGMWSDEVVSDTFVAGLHRHLRTLCPTRTTALQIELPADFDRWEATTRFHRYRIAQEALANAAKHANARQVIVALSHNNRQLELRVEDEGLRLVAGGFVQPVNVDIIPSYAEIFEDLKNKDYNTVDGVNYGVPHGRGANVLMWRTDEVTPAPTSWSEMFDPSSPYAGKFSVYDAPIYIADAAVVLMKTNPELGITNPYALDETQLQAAVDLLKQQKPAVGEYWSDYTKQITSFSQGNTVLGTTWQVIANVLQGEGVPVEVVKPEEGATGWSDTWMINSETKHLNCAYKFLNHITSAPINIQIAEYFGDAPGNSKSCELTQNPDHCTIFHAAETDYWTNVWYWTTPVEQCLDGRTDVKCTTFEDWVKAWQEVRAG